MIELCATGLVYRNPKPHLRAIHTWHPSLALLDSGELVASFDMGQGAESLDYRTYLSRSFDEGQTWSEPAPLFADTVSRRSTHSVRIGSVGGQNVVAVGGRYYRDDPEEGVANRANLGYVSMDLIYLESNDGGRTWNGPRTVEPPLVGPSFEVCATIRVLRDGRWLWPTATWKGWDGYAPNGMKSLALVSHDLGKTWPEYFDIIDGRRDGLIAWEVSLAQITDGRLVAIVWAFYEASGASRPNLYAISNDGKSFSPPREAGLKGQTAKLIALEDNRLLCLYRRESPPGLWGQLVKIEGDRWINLDEVRLWHGQPAGMAGTASSADELSGLKFGFPSMVRLPGGDVFAVFWCNENCIGNIRWLRLRVG